MANIRAKVTKSNQKGLPKLKTILANPYKTRCPTLGNGELQQFKDLVSAAIKESGQEPRVFATAKHIRLGMESGLRAINNCQSSCVFLSLSIKPSHLLGLIARNVEVKTETTPVFAQPQLEYFTEELFGVRALALVLPSNIDNLGTDLQNWVIARKKPVKEMCIKKKNQSAAIRKRKENNAPRESQKFNEETYVINAPDPIQKPWNGDFISFSNTGESIELDKLKLEDEKEKLFGVLNKMSKRCDENRPTESVQLETSVAMDCCSTSLDSDDLLEVYQPLTIHKILPNPDRRPKKKRKKNKKLK